MMIRDFSLLNYIERRYAENGLTHLDFLIYNKIGKQPVLVIETDGRAYHRQGSLRTFIDCRKQRTGRIETKLKEILHID